MSTAKKKRRRSSLAAAKNKLDFSPGLGKDVHQQIDNSLPPEERLEQLARRCFKLAVDRVSCETESQESKDQLEKVLNEVPNVLERLDMKEALHRACHSGKLLPNPQNLEMDELIKEIETRIARLKAEEEDWQTYFQDLEAQTAEAERRVTERVLPASEMTVEQRELTQEYLPTCSDLNLVKKQVTDSQNKAHILVCEHERNVEIVSRVMTELNSKLDKHLTTLHEKTCGFVGSPKANIQNLIDFPTPPSDSVTGSKV